LRVRIDLHVTVSRVSFDESVHRDATETSAVIRARVEGYRASTNRLCAANGRRED
jgi:hypothetical protein